MTIQLPLEIENQLQETARAQGLSVGQFLEKLLNETDLRRAQLSEFRAAIAERMESLDAREHVDGEEVMARLLAELPLWWADSSSVGTSRPICGNP